MAAREKQINFEQLRETVIKGIPCTFIHFEQSELEKLSEDLETDYAYAALGPLETDTHKYNMRAKVWGIICKRDQMKQDMLAEYHKARDDLVKQCKKKGKKAPEL